MSSRAPRIRRRQPTVGFLGEEPEPPAPSPPVESTLPMPARVVAPSSGSTLAERRPHEGPDGDDDDDDDDDGWGDGDPPYQLPMHAAIDVTENVEPLAPLPTDGCTSTPPPRPDVRQFRETLPSVRGRPVKLVRTVMVGLGLVALLRFLTAGLASPALAVWAADATIPSAVVVVSNGTSNVDASWSQVETTGRRALAGVLGFGTTSSQTAFFSTEPVLAWRSQWGLADRHFGVCSALWNRAHGGLTKATFAAFLLSVVACTTAVAVLYAHIVGLAHRPCFVFPNNTTNPTSSSAAAAATSTDDGVATIAARDTFDAVAAPHAPFGAEASHEESPRPKKSSAAGDDHHRHHPPPPPPSQDQTCCSVSMGRLAVGCGVVSVVSWVVAESLIAGATIDAPADIEVDGSSALVAGPAVGAFGAATMLVVALLGGVVDCRVPPSADSNAFSTSVFHRFDTTIAALRHMLLVRTSLATVAVVLLWSSMWTTAHLEVAGVRVALREAGSNQTTDWTCRSNAMQACCWVLAAGPPTVSSSSSSPSDAGLQHADRLVAATVGLTVTGVALGLVAPVLLSNAAVLLHVAAAACALASGALYVTEGDVYSAGVQPLWDGAAVSLIGAILGVLLVRGC